MLLPRPDVVQVTLLPTVDVQQFSCIANKIWCTLCHIANNWRTAFML